MPTEANPLIHAELAAILDELPAVGKDSTNSGLGFKFRGIDAMVNALNPLLGKHGVVPVPIETALLRWEQKQKGYAAVLEITYQLTARDGSYVTAKGIGEGHDFGDKAVSKAATMAEKMMLGQTFCMAYEDDPDGDTVVGETPPAPSGDRRAENPGAAQAETPAPPAPPGPRTLDARRAWCFSAAKDLPANALGAFKEEMAERGIGMDFSVHTEEQVAWLEDKLAPF